MKIELLSLPRRPTRKSQPIRNIGTFTGLPINSLPGWEQIPLNSKLPMLKCPGNQVIFSKDKIGHSFRHLKQEFDSSGVSGYPEYNPLHDSNLKNFYSIERNLKRLRENGEITANNDVICNLKDFNEYRQLLHKTQLYYVLQELNRLEAEHHDRMLISNAEGITNRDHLNLPARQYTYGSILLRKERLDQERRLKFIRMLQKTEEKFDRIAATEEMRKTVIEHKKTLNKLKMQHHRDISNDLKRKHLISLKKLFQFKRDRLKKNFRILAETRQQQANTSQITSWMKRLNERIESQNKIQQLLQEAAKQKQTFIETHQQIYQRKWDKIQEEIRNRSLRKKTKKKPKVRRIKKQIFEEEPRESAQGFEEIFQQMVESELCEALNTALDLESKSKIPFNADDPIYKAGKFIMQNIIGNYKKDLSEDEVASECVSMRISKFFDDAKKFVLFRASQIISSARGFLKESREEPHFRPQRYQICKVSFSKFSSTIGTSSYEIHPFIDLRSTHARTPTPGGSLTSMVMDSHESLVGKIRTTHLDRTDMIFIEHYIVKFKRELIVGMGKRVFAAIRCYFEDKIMEVRKELLDMDREFLIKQATSAILSYARNPINFETSLKICTSALSSDIISSLQKHLLRPNREPCFIMPRSQCCHGGISRMGLCRHCH